MHDLCPDFVRAAFPEPGDPELLRLGTERWAEAISVADDNGLSEAFEAINGHKTGKRFFSAIFGNSPFLTQICLTEPGFVLDLLTRGPEACARDVLEEVTKIARTADNQATLARDLRRARRRIALAVASAEIAGARPLTDTTAWLSDFADRAIGAATSFVLRQAVRSGQLALPDSEDPANDSGFIVLAMGKLGARELNYSSDVDLIVFYDPEKLSTSDPEALQKRCIRMTRDIARLIDERTPDGYVFRTDFRLRPDPGATPLAVSLPAAEYYYESHGQNWERAAMIKARAIAGDVPAGRDFLKWLTPFVWRRNLDFAAIQDIHSIKRQINVHRGGGSIAVAGHNIKLGRGGIREIEFFAQTQQLIWGGREPDLRQPGTIAALRALAKHGQVRETVAEEMITAYEFLRRTEHRLQMVNDEQTQILPDDELGLQALAAFMGYSDASGFGADVRRHLERVEDHYARLFEDAPALSAEGEISGNLVFTGSDADPDTIQTITRLGFAQPEKVDAAIRGWHHGRYRATRSTRARELLTELTPVLLRALANAPDPDATFHKFDEFLSGLPAGVQLFSMFHSNPDLLDLLAEIMGEAPRLADQLSRRPSLLDSLLSANFLERAPELKTLKADLSKRLGEAQHFEEALDLVRRWTNEHKFIVGMQSLEGTISPPRAAWVLSDIAETALDCLQPIVEREFVARHGQIAGSRFSVVALGKLGGHEMTPTSDLDLVFLYDAPDDVGESDGDKPLSTTHYFARLAQRFINAVTAMTAEGSLYEVDMRLRPSGKAGPIASSLNAFRQYHRDSSWTWERMAMTRARPVTGPGDFRREVAEAIREVLARPCDPDRLVADVADMRARMDAEHHTDSVWAIKHLRGGLVDLEFIVQYLQLRYAHEHPDVLSPNVWRALKNLVRKGLIQQEQADVLFRAIDLWQALQSRLHLTLETDMEKARSVKMPKALELHLAELGGARNIAHVEEIIRRTARDVLKVYESLIGPPAR